MVDSPWACHASESVRSVERWVELLPDVDSVASVRRLGLLLGVDSHSDEVLSTTRAL